jgi:hypothetical protein
MKIQAGIICALLTTAITSGCGGIQLKRPDWPWHGNPCKPINSTENNKPFKCEEHHAIEAFILANKYCLETKNSYDKGGNAGDIMKTSIGVIGTLAGAVFSPIAKGTAAAAWSGLSGASNGMQLAVEESFSSSLSIARSNYIVAAANAGEKEFLKKGNADPTMRIFNAVSMARNCALASSIADQKATQAVGQVASDAASDVENMRASSTSPSSTENKPAAAPAPEKAASQ